MTDIETKQNIEKCKNIINEMFIIYRGKDYPEYCSSWQGSKLYFYMDEPGLTSTDRKKLLELGVRRDEEEDSFYLDISDYGLDRQ